MPLPLLLARSTRAFFSGIDCDNTALGGNLVSVLEEKPLGPSPLGVFNSQPCPREPPAMGQLQSGAPAPVGAPWGFLPCISAPGSFACESPAWLSSLGGSHLPFVLPLLWIQEEWSCSDLLSVWWLLSGRDGFKTGNLKKSFHMVGVYNTEHSRA